MINVAYSIKVTKLQSSHGANLFFSMKIIKSNAYPLPILIKLFWSNENSYRKKKIVKKKELFPAT